MLLMFLNINNQSVKVKVNRKQNKLHKGSKATTIFWLTSLQHIPPPIHPSEADVAPL